jgi:hypothetical protein
VQALTYGDQRKRHGVCDAMFKKMEKADDYLNKIVLDDEAVLI